MKTHSVKLYNASHFSFTNKHNAVSVIFKDFVIIYERNTEDTIQNGYAQADHEAYSGGTQEDRESLTNILGDFFQLLGK